MNRTNVRPTPRACFKPCAAKITCSSKRDGQFHESGKVSFSANALFARQTAKKIPRSQHFEPRDFHEKDSPPAVRRAPAIASGCWRKLSQTMQRIVIRKPEPPAARGRLARCENAGATTAGTGLNLRGMR
jgi:hypothetical protein